MDCLHAAAKATEAAAPKASKAATAAPCRIAGTPTHGASPMCIRSGFAETR